MKNRDNNVILLSLIA